VAPANFQAMTGAMTSDALAVKNSRAKWPSYGGDPTLPGLLSGRAVKKSACQNRQDANPSPIGFRTDESQRNQTDPQCDPKNAGLLSPPAPTHNPHVWNCGCAYKDTTMR
jgi:hypothetical protein